MRWLTNRYTYALVALAMMASITLQLSWLHQLFTSQQVQVGRDLEVAVSNAARQSDYLSVSKGHEKSENFRNFFLSPEWLQIKQAFTRMRKRHMGNYFSSAIKPDSTLITIGLRIANNGPASSNGKMRHIYDEGETLETVKAADKIDLMRMDSLVKSECQKAGLNVTFSHLLYDFQTGNPESPAVWKKAKNADYHSELYGYNLNFFLHTYQLVVPNTIPVVLFRMRYYLLSSLLMLVLTGLAFVFLLRVIRSQKMYSQARTAFTSNITHELKTPVSVIEAALDSITRYQLHRDPVRLENYMEISKAELHRLTLMLDKVLNLDQLDHGEIKLRKELYDVHQGLESVISSMRLRNSQKSTIQYLPAAEPCFVDGDPVHLTNVFYNLIDNALKYSGPNAVIKVYTEIAVGKVLIHFQDNGPGIDSIYKSRIFDRFFRISENPDVHNVKGSGLGLHYVKQIIEQHGGKIHLSSESGKGSHFTLEIPAFHEI